MLYGCSSFTIKRKLVPSSCFHIVTVNQIELHATCYMSKMLKMLKVIGIAILTMTPTLLCTASFVSGAFRADMLDLVASQQ